MRLKKLAAAALAAGLCFVSAAAPVKADMSNVEVATDAAEKDTDFVRLSAMEKDFDITEVYGAEVTFTCADISNGVGGGFIINCDSNGWDQVEWGNDGAGKAITAVPTGNADEYTITRMSDAPVFQADNTYANFCISHWWGGNIVITDVKFLGADGKALGAAAEAPTTDTADTAAPSENLPKTGLVSSVAFLAAGALLSGAGVVVAKKKENE